MIIKYCGILFCFSGFFKLLNGLCQCFLIYNVNVKHQHPFELALFFNHIPRLPIFVTVFNLS